MLIVPEADVLAVPDPDTFELYEHLIRTGAWWDLVDETSHRVGDVLRAHRHTQTSVVERWSTSDSLCWTMVRSNRRNRGRAGGTGYAVGGPDETGAAAAPALSLPATQRPDQATGQHGGRD